LDGSVRSSHLGFIIKVFLIRIFLIKGFVKGFITKVFLLKGLDRFFLIGGLLNSFIGEAAFSFTALDGFILQGNLVFL